ncbi:oligosaccharide flippase family protein [Rhizobium sp. AG855]|uniref:oligosaccharide flippase family protein n=1 Tax=Rhizobium sp. AG855 TaxID=2183898 RepID=UPI000E723193|nr:oligosaccharide flippase family protein [Rhizobium sp. AG855]RKE77550.1 O-antigen/teichoic acid export membrane protein [Rhizobium sp. AG855]
MTEPSAAPLTDRTIHAGLWTVGARLASRVIDFLTLLVLARFLGPADFGLVATAMTLIFIVEAVLELPLASALLRLPEITARAYSTAFTLGLLRGLLVAGLMAALAWPIARIYGDERLVLLVCTLALAPATRGLISPRMILFEKAMDFRRRGVLELLGKTLAATVAISIAVTTGSYWAITAGTVMTPTVMMLCSYVMAPMRPRLTLADWPLFADLVGWNFISQTISAINWQIDRILLPRFIDVASFGRFAAANDLSALPYQAVVAPASGPLMAAFASARDNGRIREAYLSSSGGLILMLLPIFVFMAMLSGPVIRVLLGPQWDGASPILAGLALAGLLAVPAIPMPPLVMVLGHSRSLATRSLMELIVRVPLSLVGVTFFGIPGAIIARAGGSLAVSVSSMALVKSAAGIGILDQLRVAQRPILSIIPSVLVLLACKHYLDFEQDLYVAFFASGILFCLTYAVSGYALWVIAKRPGGVEASAFRILSKILQRH